MKLKDFYLEIKSNNKDVIVFVKYGNFYKCFDNDLYIINKNSFGFKVNIIDNNISYIVKFG